MLDIAGYDLTERTAGRVGLSMEARRDLERQVGHPVQAGRSRFVRCRFVSRDSETERSS